MSDWADEKANEWLIRHSVLIGFYGRESTSGKPLFDSLAALLRGVAREGSIGLGLVIGRAEAKAEIERLRFELEKRHDWNGPALRDCQARLREVDRQVTECEEFGIERFDPSMTELLKRLRAALAAAQPKEEP